MTLFPDLRADLVTAMDRRPRSRRAPLALAVAAIVALLAFGATTIDRPAGPARPAATPTPTPAVPAAIEKAVSRDGGPVAGTPILQLRVSDDSGLEWDTAAWASDGDAVSFTQALAGSRLQRWGVTGAGTLPIALNLRAASLGAQRLDVAIKDGKPHYIVVGIVESRATGVRVTLEHQRREAALSSALLTRPVRVDPASLTPEGRRQAADLPGEISVRLFAVAFAAGKPKTQTVQPTIRVTRPDGTTSTQYGPRFCVTRACGAVFPRVG